MRKNLFILIFGLIGVLLVSSCSKKRGCTNPTADNYNSEAVEDDDTCIPTRFKFVGAYDGYGTIEDEPNVLISYDQVGINIVDSTAVGVTGLIIGISNFDVPLVALSGTVIGTYDILVGYQEIGVYAYWGDGNINGRVIEFDLTRTEEITLPDMTTVKDTISLNLYGLKEID